MSVGLFDDLSSDPVSDWKPSAPPSLSGVTEIGFDTETDGLKWFRKDRPVGISIYRPGMPTGEYFPWAQKGGGNLSESVVKEWARRELRGKKLVGAHIKFDIHMMREWGVDLEEQGCTATDVQHQAALLDDHRRQFSLNALSLEFLGKPKVGTELDGKRMSEYHSSMVAPRAMADAQWSYELDRVFAPLLAAQELEVVKALEDNVIWPTVEMEKNGAPLDVELLDRWVNESEIAYTRTLLSIRDDVGFLVNPRSRSDMVRLWQKLQLPLIHFTDSGNPSFDDHVLKEHLNHPVVAKIRYASKVQSLRAKFLVAYQEAVESDGILRYSLHQLRSEDGGTISGRFSCSGKNMQQLSDPGKQRIAFGFDEKDESHDDEIFIIRRLIIPREGDLLAADAKQVEYRGFAHYSASPKILEVYRKDPHADFHNVVRDMILQVREITRKRTKDVNFAFIFGAGPDKIAAMLELPRSESDQVVKAYKRAFPEADALMKKAMHLAKTRGYIKTITGRRGRFPDRQRLHKALNVAIQGTAADIAKQKSVELHRERKWTGLTLRFPVHDEFVGDATLREVTKERVTEILNRQSFKMLVPILWDVKIGPNWAVC